MLTHSCLDGVEGRSGERPVGAQRGAIGVFHSTVEKQMDAKRRIVLPAEFRAAAAGPFDGIFCFPSIEADCIEGGGQALFDRYRSEIEALPFGDELRTALETCVIGGMVKLGFDVAGRITLPDALCQQFGLTDEVVVVGMGERFQIWSASAWRDRLAEQRRIAREQFPKLRARQVAGAQA